MNFTSFQELLLWLGPSGGAAIVVAVFVSWFLEDWPRWKAVPANLKYAFQVGASMLLGALAVLLLRLPSDNLAAVDPWIVAFFAVGNAMIGYISNQGGFKLRKFLEK